MVSKWSQNGAKMVPNGVTEASRRGNFDKSVTDSELLRNTCSIFAPKVAPKLPKRLPKWTPNRKKIDKESNEKINADF